MNCDPTSLMEAAKCYRCIPKGMQNAVIDYLLCQWLENKEPESCTDPIVDDWLARIAAGGATRPSDNTIQAVCRFCKALRAAGLVNKFYAINPVIPDSLGAMLYPLLYTVGVSPWINNPLSLFVPADLTVNGLQGQGDTIGKYIDTGVDPSVSINFLSAGLSIIQSGPKTVVQAREIDMGVYTGFDVVACFELSGWDPASLGPIGCCWASGVDNVQAESNAFYSMSRVSKNDLRLYQASSLVPFVQLDFNNIDITIGPEEQPTASIYFMAEHYKDFLIEAAQDNTSKRISFVAIHTGFSAVETQALYNAAQQLRLDLGGGSV